MSQLSKRDRLVILECAAEIAAEAAQNPNVVWMIEFQEELVEALYRKMTALVELDLQGGEEDEGEDDAAEAESDEPEEEDEEEDDEAEEEEDVPVKEPVRDQRAVKADKQPLAPASARKRKGKAKSAKKPD
jgi:hypothetical protein